MQSKFFLVIIYISTVFAVNFHFPHYSYKAKAKNENLLSKLNGACAPVCSGPEIGSDIDVTKCIRMCSSPYCYDRIYAFDELEPGEIDVRANSYKGCAVKHWNKGLHIL